MYGYHVCLHTVILKGRVNLSIYFLKFILTSSVQIWLYIKCKITSEIKKKNCIVHFLTLCSPSSTFGTTVARQLRLLAEHGYNTKGDHSTVLQYNTHNNTVVMAGLYCMHSHNPEHHRIMITKVNFLLHSLSLIFKHRVF